MFRLQAVRQLCAAGLVRLGTALGRLWDGSKMRKGPSLLAWDGVTGEGEAKAEG
jgi:hypothetical protein